MSNNKQYQFVKSAIAALVMGAGTILSAGSAVHVQRGVRPKIPDSLITEENCIPGVIRIKLTTEAQRTSRIRNRRSSADIRTSLSELDSLNSRFGATEIQPTFNLYSTDSRSVRSQRNRHEQWGFDRWYDISISTDSLSAAVNAFGNLSDVAIAEPVYKKVRNSTEDSRNGEWIPNDPEYEKQWHYHNTGQDGSTIGADINLQKAWYYERGFEEILVAVVDGGIDPDHPDLKANIWERIGYNFCDDNNNVFGDYHGTHVGGTVAAVNNNGIGVSGVAGGSGPTVGDGVRLMSCQIFSGPAFGGTAEALIWAADNGAVISQNSWSYGDSLIFNQSDLDAIDYFNANGGGDALVGGVSIFSAGNRGLEGTYYPGCYEGAFSVAAIDNTLKRAEYSNHGDWVDITAPGGDKIKGLGVYSTDVGGDYRYLDGTSMACPHVSGVAALILSHAYRNGVVLTADQLKELLQQSADNVFLGTDLGKMGAGLVNAGEAISLLNRKYLSDLQAPYEFSAEQIDGNSASLQWRTNDSDMPVIVTASRQNDFTAPLDGNSYSVGDLIGNSEVIYVGSETTASHGDLPAADTVQYRIYSMNSGKYSGYRSGFVVTDHFEQNGTEADPYLIETLADLQTIMAFPRYWDNHIRLNASLNAAESRDWNNGRGWTPIGSEQIPFSGVFAGGGHTIDSLYIKKSSEFTSLFGVVENGTIDSLGLRDVSFSGKGYTAGFVGKIKPGTISSSFVTGSISGGVFTGGFAGLLHTATVSDCYAQVDVNGGMYVGGFAGSCFSSTVNNSYSAGAVAGENTYGGFAGAGDGKGVTASFWDSEKAGISTSKVGTAATTQEMQGNDLYSAWNFTTIWKKSNQANYPILNWESNNDPTAIVVQKSTGSGVGITIANNPVAKASSNCSIELKSKESATVLFTVYDALGNSLAKSGTIRTSQGSAQFNWDLTNQAGQKVGSGSYLLIAKVDLQGRVEFLKELIGVSE